MTIPRIFDRRTYALRRRRARDNFLSRDVGDNLAERLGAVNRRFVDALDLSARADVHSAIQPFAENWTRTSLWAGPGAVTADEEALPFAPQTFDLAVSALSLHAVNDLPGALAQIRQVLKPDGLFVAALFGGSTLGELRTAFASGESEVRGGISPRVAPFADIRELGTLMQRAGFALPVTDSETTIVRYGSFLTLRDDLRALGETNALAGRARNFLRRDVLSAMLASYQAQSADEEGRLVATFEVVYLTAWSPHESQPQPLRPGSAKMRLADALGLETPAVGGGPSPPQDA